MIVDSIDALTLAEVNNVLPNQITIFGLTVQLMWQPIELKPQSEYECTPEHFYLNICDVAAYWVNPQLNQIIIESANATINYTIISTWLFGTVMAYLLQYHGYLVLHGSAVLINKQAVIFSGDSGAGKSTTAGALVKKGYPLLTDDVVVVKTLADGTMVLIPGPPKLKLWADALILLEHDSNGLQPVVNKRDKYQFPTDNHEVKLYPIGRFYELNPNSVANGISCDELFGIDKLHILIKNTYRYNMLKPLNQLSIHFKSCSKLSAQINVFQIKLLRDSQSMAKIIELLENHTVKIN